MEIYKNMWIGLAEVSCRPGNNLLGSAKGAFVNVLAIATNSIEFIDKVKIAIMDLGLDFVQIEDVEPFSERRENYEMDELIINLATDVYKSKELRFGNFHTYED